MDTQIRPYNPSTDRDAAFRLWEATLANIWPLHPDGFYRMIDSQAAHHLVVTTGSEITGFIALSKDSQESASIVAIAVPSARQMRDIEHRLLTAAEEHFRSFGVTTLRFGGGQSYFWPGVPTDQPHILELLERTGWQAGGHLTDMVGDVATAHVPQDTIDRIARSGANIRLATAEDRPAILAFEAQHFPQWRSTASMEIEQGDYANIVLAELDGEIVGTNFLTPPGSSDFLWSRMLGDTCAAFGALGVSEAVRGRYIGYALAVRAAEVLRERGAEQIFLGWVFSTEWYERLGYRAWKTYRAVNKELS